MEAIQLHFSPDICRLPCLVSTSDSSERSQMPGAPVNSGMPRSANSVIVPFPASGVLMREPFLSRAVQGWLHAEASCAIYLTVETAPCLHLGLLPKVTLELWSPVSLPHLPLGAHRAYHSLWLHTCFLTFCLPPSHLTITLIITSLCPVSATLSQSTALNRCSMAGSVF
jgi:hypothetical protein